MKIIIEGKIPTPKLPAWVELKLTCRICNTLFELEEDDYPEIISERSRNIFSKDYVVKVQCPFCKAFISAKICN